jgi:hypothetical protein
MQFNILKLYFNGLMKISTFFKLSNFYMILIINFELIETIIQMFHITLINIYYNTYNNLMPHIYT